MSGIIAAETGAFKSGIEVDPFVTDINLRPGVAAESLGAIGGRPRWESWPSPRAQSSQRLPMGSAVLVP